MEKRKIDMKNFLKTFIYKLRDGNVSASGAQLAYYLVISVFPFIIFFLNILSMTPLADENVLLNVLIYLPFEIQEIILNLVRETVSSSNEALLSFSAITGVWAASKGTMAIIKSINKAYEIEEARSYVVLRAIAVVFTLALLILLLLVLATLVFGEILGNQLFNFLGLAENFLSFWHYFRILISLVSMVLIFALLYRFSPSIKKFREIEFIYTLPGAIFSTLGWIISSLAFSYYVNNFGNFSKTYGSLGGIIVLLLWLYMISIILIIGGVINGTIHTIKKTN